MKRFAVAVALALAVSAGLACAARPAPAPQAQAICATAKATLEGERVRAAEEAGQRPPKGALTLDNLRPAEWFALLLERAPDGRIADCTLTPLTWEPGATSCVEPDEIGDLLPWHALTPEDLVVSRISADTRLVWVIAQRFSTGEGVGPVALVQDRHGSLDVVAVGTLRAWPRRARLSLQALGKGWLLVADGEHCAEAEGTACRRGLSLLVLDKQRFWEVPFRLADGRCLGPARVDLARVEETSLGDGWSRRFQVVTAPRFEAARLVLGEQVVANDYDPKRPEMPPRPFRRAEGERLVRLVGTRLVVSDTSLWRQVFEARGSVKGQDGR